MKKLIALIFAMLFLGTGIASATDFTLGGSYYVRGSYFYNVQQYPAEDNSSYGVYDHELSVDATWQIDDTTKVFARFEMADEKWGTDSSIINEGTIDTDNNVYLEQVWATHTFGNGGALTVGKMSAGAWGTAFNDAGDEAFRIKYIQPTGIGKLIGILQKNDDGEIGADGGDESDDSDAYIAGLITKAGDITIMPLFVYSEDIMIAGNFVDAYQYKLALNGEFGTLGFEAEVDYSELDFDDSAIEGGKTYGAYLNVWNTMDALTIGALAAWGSFDDDADIGSAFDFGDDFEAGGALIMGDDITFSGGDDLNASTLFAVYADYAVDAKLSIGGYAGYAQSNVDDGSDYDGADIWEVSGDVTYAITDSLTYKVAAGYAQIDVDLSYAYDADESWEVYNKLSFSF